MPQDAPVPIAPAADATPSPAQKPADTAASASSTSKLPEGVTTIDDKVFLECEILAYKAVSRISRQIGFEVRAAVDVAAPAGTPATIILLDETLASAFQLYSALIVQLGLFVRAFKSVAPEGSPQEQKSKTKLAAFTQVSLASKTVTGLLAGVVDLVGLFRQDTQLSGRAVSVQETALFLELARSLRFKGLKVVYPRLFGFQAQSNTSASDTGLTELFESVFSAREKAVTRLRPQLNKIAELEKEILDRQLELPTASPDRQKELTKEIDAKNAFLADARRNLDPDLVPFENTDTQWSDLQKGLHTPDGKSGQVPMQLLNRAAQSIQQFHDANPDPAFFLYAEAVVAGGTMRIHRNLWRTLFQGDGISFSGGAVVSYALFDGMAALLTSGTHRYMTPFQEFPASRHKASGFNSC